MTRPKTTWKMCLILLVASTITFKTSITAANEPREVEGVPCEVCVSEQYIENHRDLVDDLKLRIDDLKEKRAAAAALAEDRKERIQKLEAKLEKTPNRWVWFGIGSGSTVIVGLVTLLLVSR